MKNKNCVIYSMITNCCAKGHLLVLLSLLAFESSSFSKVLDFERYKASKTIQYDDSLRKAGVRFFPPVRVVNVAEVTNNHYEALSGKLAITPLVLNDISKNSVDIYFDEPQDLVSFFVVSQKWYDPESVIEYKTELFGPENTRLSSFTTYANSSEDWKKISVRSRGIRKIKVTSRNFSFMYPDNYFLIDNIEFSNTPAKVSFTGDTTPPEIEILNPAPYADIVNNKLHLEIRGGDDNGIFSLEAQLYHENGAHLLYEQTLCGDLRNGYCASINERKNVSYLLTIPENVLYAPSGEEQNCQYLLRVVAKDMEGNESYKDKLIRVSKIPEMLLVNTPEIRSCQPEDKEKITRAFTILRSNAREILQQVEFMNAKEEVFPGKKQLELQERYVRRFEDVEIIICSSKPGKGKGFFSPFSKKLYIFMGDNQNEDISLNELIARLAVQMSHKAPIPDGGNGKSQIPQNLQMIYKSTLDWAKLHCIR